LVEEEVILEGLEWGDIVARGAEGRREVVVVVQRKEG